MPISPDKKPISFSFNNTERCQSRCITCNGWKTPAEVMQQELTLDEWKQILTNLHNWMGNYQFIISGGEPFIRDDIFEIAQFASDLDKATKDQLTRGKKLTEVLKQPQYAPLSVAKQISILFAANEGLLDDVNDLRIKDFKNGWFDFFEANMKDLVQRLDNGEKLSDEDKVELTKMVNKYKTNFFK